MSLAEDQFEIILHAVTHSDIAKARSFFRTSILPYLGREDKKEWDSWVTDDNSPYDWSLVLSKSSTCFRVIWEPQCPNPNMDNMKKLSLNYLADLQKDYDADISLLRPIEDFLSGPMAKNCWFATDFSSSPLFKIYLGGCEQPVFAQLAEKLSIGNTFQMVAQKLPNHVIEGYGIDLVPNGRIKVYFRVLEATASSILSILKDTNVPMEDGLQDFLHQFLPDSSDFSVVAERYRSFKTEVYYPSCVTLTYSFVVGSSTPHSCKIHLPVRYYYNNDETILRKVLTYLHNHISEDAATKYERTIRKLCTHRELSKKTGIQSVLSYSHPPGKEIEFTAYISPERYAPERMLQK